MMENGNPKGDPEVPGRPNQPDPAAGDPEVPGDDNDTIAFGEPESAGDPEVPGDSDPQ